MPEVRMARAHAGWQTIAFGNAVRNVTDRAEPTGDDSEFYVGLEHLDSGSLTVRRWGSERELEGTKLRMRKGDVLFAKRNAYLKRVAIAPHDGLFSAHGMVLRANPDVLLHEFLPFFMQSDHFWERAIGISVGSLSPTINWNTLAAEEFALPPIEEQRRIAGALMSAHASLESNYRLEQAIDGVRFSYYRQIFLANRGHRTTHRIGEVADVRNGTTPSRANPNYWNGNIPWLPTGKVNDRRIIAADEYITKKALSECSLSIIPAGAILIAMIGQGTTRGRAALLELDATINQNFAAVIPGPCVGSDFLFYQLEALYEGLRAWSQGSNQLALNCQLVADFPIWVPSEVEQREVCAIILRLEQQKVEAEQRMTKLRRVTSALVSRTIESAI